MALPKPPSSLDDSCSVIRDNTLYTYTKDAFLALPLDEGAKWQKLKMGEKVSGAACVGQGDSAFWVVGGTGGSGGYSGLQKYDYAAKEWTTVTPTVPVTHERQWHGATYIKANNMILVYAGSQDGVRAPSTQTFTIQASEPYEVNSYDTSGNSNPAIQPILLAWSDADACLVGGDIGNTAVALFNPAAGWRNSGAVLAQPFLKDSKSIQAILMPGSDGSKSLYTFDLTTSPNQVDRYVLQDASGAPVVKWVPTDQAKRDLTLDDWPKYNSTLAPTATRQGYAIAQGADNMVVFSGGNAEEPIAMFDATENSWMNATQVLGEQEQKILSESTSTSASSSTTSTSTKSKSKTHSSTTLSTASATATDTSISSISETSAVATTDAAAAAAAGNSDDGGLSSNAILGITLGIILGFMALLGLILFLLRRRKARKQHADAGHARRDSGRPLPPLDEKDPIAFANGAHPPPSPGHFRGHQHQGSNESYSSMAILMGRVGQQKTSLTRKPSNDTSRSSVSSLHKQQFKSTISKPILQQTPAPITRPRMAEPHIAQHPALQGRDDKGVAFDPSVAEPRSRNSPMEADDGTRRSSGWNRYWSGGSALQVLGFGGSKRNTQGSEQSSRYSEAAQHHNPRVTQDSATVPPLNFDFHPEVNSVNSGSPVVASYGTKIPFSNGMAGKIERPPSKTSSSGYSSGIPESVNDEWERRDTTKPWGADRAPDNAYQPSFYFGTPLSPSTGKPRHPPSGISKQPQLAMASTSSDMSWLNLGDQSRV
ncbi:Fc.00g065400.m01.CDS01 [Cosmosporella sp. VM-42]